MKKVFYISFIFLGSFFMSCSKKVVPALQKNPDQELMGTWKWTKTSGGFANQTKTPESTGESRSIQFANDNQYFMYLNESITSYGTYTVETRQCIHDHSYKHWINFSSANDKDQMIEKMDVINLELSDDVYDGFDNYYTKTK